MNILAEQTSYIQECFKTMKDKTEFLLLLNYVKKIIYGEKTLPFEIRNLNYYINSHDAKKTYNSFTIKKKTGGLRYIHAPNEGLKAIQSCISLLLQEVYEVNPAVYGFVKGRSIVDNARVHVGQHYVFNIDLKDFFSSIDQARIWGRLRISPFNLDQKSNRQKLANIIALLCCHSLEVERPDGNGGWMKVSRNVLPQGAPSSPVLTNMICETLDRRLLGVAKRFGLRYSRYADDITFSSLHNVYSPEGDFFNEIKRIISEQNLYIKSSKTRLQGEGYRQEVTGLIVNNDVNVSKRYIKEIRKWLYLWENYGYDKTYVFFNEHYTGEKGHVRKQKPNMSRILEGKLEFLRMVKGAENKLYDKLETRFRALMPKEGTMREILDIWEKLGIDKAMDKYYEHHTIN